VVERATGADGDLPEDAEPQEHRLDGLDLARSMVRGAAGSGTPAQGKRRKWGRRPDGKRLRRGEVPVSGAHPGERDPQLLGSELDRLVDDRGWALDLKVRGVFARWTELVGPEIGAHSTPETLTDGTLVVRTDSTAWATQLKLLTGSVVKRLNTELGDGTVTTVEVLGPHAPSWKHGRRGTRDGRGPRDTYG
jgi:predicted nucleic acid-binding Zn ribbon protein